MKKYIEISKILFKAQITYRFDAIMSMLFTITKILFAYILWGAIFGESEMVAGFTYPMMLTYYIISSFLSQIDMSGKVSEDISNRIRGGTFSKYMVMPVNTQGYFTAQTFGTMAFHLIFNLLAAIIWVFIFKIECVFTKNTAVIFGAICIVILGLLFMIQFNYFLGILAFKFLDIEFLLIIKTNIISFVTGLLIPLVLLPTGMLTGMKFLPFYYVTYLPSMLLIGKNENEVVSGILIITVWLTAFMMINKIVYNKMRIIYDGVGI